MATSATLSDLADVHARLHDLAVVALRTRGRQRDLLAAVPARSSWSGPGAVAYTTHRLVTRSAALGALADALDAVAAQLRGVARELPAVLLAAGLDDRSSAAAVRHAQRLLNRAGAAAGRADGVWGFSTGAAVVSVQVSAGLPATGSIDPATALAISAAAAGGAVEIGSPPAMPRGLTPLAGRHPVVAQPPATAPTGAQAGMGPPPATDPATPAPEVPPVADPDGGGGDGGGDAGGDGGVGDGGTAGDGGDAGVGGGVGDGLGAGGTSEGVDALP